MATPKGISGKLHTFRYEDAVKSIGRDVMAEVLKILLTENSTKSIISEQIKDLGIFQKFKQDVQQKIEMQPIEEWDITFLYSIILKFYEHTKIPHDQLKLLLREIKSQRNTVCHEKLKLTHQELQNKLSDFKSTLEKTINETKNLYPVSHHPSTNLLATLMGDVDQEIKDILDEKVREDLDPSSPKDNKRKIEEDKRFGSQNQEYVQEESRSALKPKLKRSCKTLLLKWLSRSRATDPSNIAVILQMETHKEFQGFKSSDEPATTVSQMEILTLKDTSGDDAEVVIISGQAGGGKTTLLRLVGEKWSKEDTGDFTALCDYPILFYVEFRNTKLNSLDDYLCVNLKEIVDKFGIITVRKSILNPRSLFLCDGFDEKNEKSESLFEEILESSSKVIVTTRPINTQDLTKMVNQCNKSRVNLKLLGIPEGSLNECIVKLVNLHVSDPDKRKETTLNINQALTTMAPEARKLLKIPLYNTLIIMLLMDCPHMKESIRTVTGLYLEMKKHELKQFLDKMGYKDKEKNVLQFLEFYNDMSLKSHLAHKHDELSEEEVQAFQAKCVELDLPFQDVMSTFFTTKYALNSSDTEKIFCNKHRTEQEFAAARAISEMLKINKENYENNILVWLFKVMHMNMEALPGISKHMQNVLTFLTGILAHSNLVDKHANQIINAVHLEYNTFDQLSLEPLLQLLSESGNNMRVLDAIAQRLQHTSHEWHIKDSKNLSSLTVLLSKSEPNTVLRLEFYEEDPEILTHLEQALKVAALNQVEVELRMWHHYGTGSGHDDNYIKVSGNLTDFAGNIRNCNICQIPNQIRVLQLRMDKKTVPALNHRLLSLNELFFLGLMIPYIEISDRDNFCPVMYKGKCLRIEIDLRGHEGGDSEARPCAEAINNLWPRVSQKAKAASEELRCEEQDTICILFSRFTKSGVEEFLTTLKMTSLKEITIHLTVGISDADETRLSELNRHKGFRKLNLLFKD